MVLNPPVRQIAKRIILMLLVGGFLYWLIKEPTDNSDFLSEIVKTLSKRVLSNLGGLE